MVSIVPPGPDGKPDTPAPCTTMGCDEPATLVGNLYDHDVVYEGIAYCPECAGYLYQQFEIVGPVR